MIIQVSTEDGHVSAMGHRVSLEQGGIAELKRRCFESLVRLSDPPDEVVFRRHGAVPEQRPDPARSASTGGRRRR